jgi:hypothetical protein
MNPFSSNEYKMFFEMKDEIIRANNLLLFHEKVEEQYHFRMIVNGYDKYYDKYNIAKGYYTYKEIIHMTQNNRQARSDLLFDYHLQFEEYIKYKNSKNDKNIKDIKDIKDTRTSNFFSVFFKILFRICDADD